MFYLVRYPDWVKCVCDTSLHEEIDTHTELKYRLRISLKNSLSAIILSFIRLQLVKQNICLWVGRGGGGGGGRDSLE